MKKNGKGEIKLTNPVHTQDYRTRADRAAANAREKGMIYLQQDPKLRLKNLWKNF